MLMSEQNDERSVATKVDQGTEAGKQNKILMKEHFEI